MTMSVFGNGRGSGVALCTRWLGLIMAVVVVMAMLVGCDQSDSRERVRVLAVTVPGTPWHDMWARFGAAAEQLPEPSIRVELFVLSQFGPEENMIANLRRNRAQIAGLSLQGASQVVPELNLLLAPYLFESQQELDFILDNYLLAAYSELLEEQGLTIIQWADVGWTHLYARQPMLEPEQVQGQRLRTSRASGARIFGRVLEANQIVLPFTDVIPSLQTGLIDGGQSGVGMFAMAGIASEANHLMLTAHAYDAGLIVANAAWWKGLTPDVRGQIRQALDPVDQTRVDVRALIARLEAGLRANPDVTVHDLKPDQRLAWQAASADATAQLIDQIGGRATEIYQRIQEGKAAFQAHHAQAHEANQSDD